MRKIYYKYPHRIHTASDPVEEPATFRKSPGYGTSFLHTSKAPLQQQKTQATPMAAIQMDKQPGEYIKEHTHPDTLRKINLSFYEDIYSDLGKIHIDKLKSGKQNTSSTSGGDTKPVDPFSNAPWFTELQNLLIQRTTWGKDEEEAQNLLRDYVMMRIEHSPTGKMYPSILHMLRYIGRSEANDAANAKYKNEEGKATPRASDLGGTKDSANWCAQASSTVIIKALAEKGLKFKNGYVDWLSKGKGKSKLVTGKAAHTAKLSPGDIISLIGFGTPVSGHVATVIEEQGDKILMVSGNAGGGGGSVRVEEVTRAQPLVAYDWGKAVSENQEAKPGVNKPGKAGEIWVVTISQLSQLDLSQIDPNNKAQLEENGLERMPITA
jgi:hypothetical protein